MLHRMLMSELYAAQGAPQASQQHAILKVRKGVTVTASSLPITMNIMLLLTLHNLHGVICMIDHPLPITY